MVYIVGEHDGSDALSKSYERDIASLEEQCRDQDTQIKELKEQVDLHERAILNMRNQRSADATEISVLRAKVVLAADLLVRLLDRRHSPYDHDVAKAFVKGVRF